ncbi:hypothetical protein Trydic_g15365 [Trypoxylus dichotomus]
MDIKKVNDIHRPLRIADSAVVEGVTLDFTIDSVVLIAVVTLITDDVFVTVIDFVGPVRVITRSNGKKRLDDRGLSKSKPPEARIGEKKPRVAQRKE